MADSTKDGGSAHAHPNDGQSVSLSQWTYVAALESHSRVRVIITPEKIAFRLLLRRLCAARFLRATSREPLYVREGPTRARDSICNVMADASCDDWSRKCACVAFSRTRLRASKQLGALCKLGTPATSISVLETPPSRKLHK